MNYLEKTIKAVIEKKEETKEINIKKLKNFYSEASGLLNVKFKEDFESKIVFVLKYDSIIISFIIEKDSNYLVGHFNFHNNYFNIEYELEEKDEKEIEIVIKDWKEKFPSLNIDHVIEDLDKIITVDTSELDVNSLNGIFFPQKKSPKK